MADRPAKTLVEIRPGCKVTIEDAWKLANDAVLYGETFLISEGDGLYRRVDPTMIIIEASNAGATPP